MNLVSRIERELRQRKKEMLHRSLPEFGNGLDFCSNDYLGYSRLIPQIRKKRSLFFRTGSTGSRLISGNSREIAELEEYISHVHQSGSCLLFSSGFLANFGLLSTLASRHDVYLYDELCHASLIEGIRHSRARCFRFRHNDTNDLLRLLKKFSPLAQTVFIVTESVFSMDGDECPGKNWTDVLKDFDNLCLIVDEAHALGTTGPQYLGSFQYGDLPFPLIRVFTYGKALGCSGAAVTGPAWLKDYLVNFCRPFIYTTAPSAEMTCNIRIGYELLLEQQHTEDLQNNILFFQQEIKKYLPWQNYKTPIQIFPCTADQYQKSNAEEIFRRHQIECKWMRSPTVPSGKERFRITLHSFNHQDEILKLIQCLKDISSAE